MDIRYLSSHVSFCTCISAGTQNHRELFELFSRVLQRSFYFPKEEVEKRSKMVRVYESLCAEYCKEKNSGRSSRNSEGQIPNYLRIPRILDCCDSFSGQSCMEYII